MTHFYGKIGIYILKIFNLRLLNVGREIYTAAKALEDVMDNDKKLLLEQWVDAFDTPLLALREHSE
ncbi:MAG: hypothetical protein HQK66_03150 [Desulfamplus sp.]|nr:hypothetical protein [Desulfamplus sp.]